MSKILKYTQIDPKDLKRHPKHAELFGKEADSDLSEHNRSKERHGKIKPIVYVVRGDSKLLIDGEKERERAIQNGITEVMAVEVDATDEEIPALLVELNTTFHTELIQLARMAKALYDILIVGKGYRSDVQGNDEDEAAINDDGDEQDTGKKRRPTVYDKIGAKMGISAKRAMYLVKVLEQNPHHFERIDEGRSSLYAAYLECKREKDGVLPGVPKVKAPVYVTSATTVPSFSNFTSTGHFAQEERPVTSSEEASSTVTAPVDVTAAKPAAVFSVIKGGADSPDQQYIAVKGLCPCCGLEIDLFIPKSDIYGKAA